MPHSPNLPPRSQYPSNAHSSAASAFSRRKRRKNSRSRVLRSRIKRVLVVIGSVGWLLVNCSTDGGQRTTLTNSPLWRITMEVKEGANPLALRMAPLREEQWVTQSP